VTSIAGLRELRPGLWHWTAPHPDWRPGEPWDQHVSAYAIDDGERLLFFDPIAPPAELEQRAADRQTAVVLTAPWHERDTRRLVERFGMPVYTPLPDTVEYLMQTYGVTAEQAGEGSPDVAWLLREGVGEARPYAAGERLDAGVRAFPGQKPNDLVLWVESHRAVVAGDTLVDFADGLEINTRWLDAQGIPRERVVAGLRPLLELPVEHLLTTHGGPYDGAALRAALA
jgi:glyoxylase-like metal-dependent hydrolase (beta-lactamase superfamily II)